MGIDQLTMVVFTALITGGFSATATVIGLKVHISYLKDAVIKNDAAITRAHARIDQFNNKVRSIK